MGSRKNVVYDDGARRCPTAPTTEPFRLMRRAQRLQDLGVWVVTTPFLNLASKTDKYITYQVNYNFIN
jgi:hypothetical protein